MKNVLLMSVLLLAAGCASEVPVPTTHPVSYQKKLKSAHHWDVIASDTAKQAVETLGKQGLGTTAIFVTMNQPAAPFHDGFRSLLMTRLVEAGQPVAQKTTALEVQVEAQVVRGNSQGTATYPGAWTALAAGVAVARQGATHWGGNAQTAGVVALASAVDLAAGYSTKPSRTEVILTTSVVRNGTYLMRKTDVYYVDDEDGSLYEQMNKWRVVG